MFSSFHTPLTTLQFGFGRTSTPTNSRISLAPAPIHDTELHPSSSSSPACRRLKHLLKLNHFNHAILYHHRRFHNHTPHLLGSAYILGADADSLSEIYDSEARSGLVAWEDSPGEIALYDWRDFLGRREYERAFVDFFEDQVVLAGYEWKGVVERFLCQQEGGGGGGGGKEPLVNNLICGLGHGLIHLAYAFELNSREVAMEALGLVATNYDSMHRYLDEPRYGKGPTGYQTSNPLEVLARVNGDQRLDGVFSEEEEAGGGGNVDELFGRHEAIVLEHWNAWKITDPTRQFEQLQYAVVALFISAAQHHSSRPPPSQSPPIIEKQAASPKPPARKSDFFLLHLLTTTHSLRILLPHLPPHTHLSLLRQLFLLTLALYITQSRPPIQAQKHILNYDAQGREWSWVVDQALRGEYRLDAHFVKGVRAMKVVAETWGDGHGFYLKAAVRFVVEFDGWGGFSAEEEEEREQRRRKATTTTTVTTKGGEKTAG